MKVEVDDADVAYNAFDHVVNLDAYMAASVEAGMGREVASWDETYKVAGSAFVTVPV